MNLAPDTGYSAQQWKASSAFPSRIAALRGFSKSLNRLEHHPRNRQLDGSEKLGLAEYTILALTILFLAYFAYATPIILVGIWHYKKHGFGEDPGEDWDPPNVSVLVPVKNEERVVG